MANTKSKSTAKRAKETATKNNPVNSASTTIEKPRPTEEQIRRKAQELYYQRLSRGEYGTAIDDWQKAEQLLTEEL